MAVFCPKVLICEPTFPRYFCVFLCQLGNTFSQVFEKHVFGLKEVLKGKLIAIEVDETTDDREFQVVFQNRNELAASNSFHRSFT